MCSLILLKNPLCALTKSWHIIPKQDFKVWNIYPGVLAVLKYDIIIYSDLTLSAILVQLILVYSLL